MLRVFTDADLAPLDPSLAVEWMLEALRLRATGLLVSPPRLHADLGDGRLVVTPGHGPRWYGHRSYDTLPTASGEQVVVAHDSRSGNVAAIHVGNELGAIRTGALGGAAAALLGPTGPCTVAVVGAGRQAWSQLWALTAPLDIRDVVITSRTTTNAEAMARRAATDLGLPARVEPDTQQAVQDADVVVLATTSPIPVFQASWLSPDVFVTTLGPKQQGRAEFGLDLLDGASIVATDSPDQLHAYTPPALVSVAGRADQVTDLAQLAAGGISAPRTGRRVYLSVGLSGTEVHLLGHLADHLA